MSKEFDVIWVGTGQATLTVVPRLIDAGKTVAVVEGGNFGGTCVNTGCTPTKTLVASAYAMHLARRGDEFGFEIGDLQVDFAKAMGTQQTNRASSTGWIENRLRSLEGSTVFADYGRFVDAHTIAVGDRQIYGKTIVVNAGSRPRKPDVEGIDSISWLSNENLLDLTELPEHLIVVGGSYIALEFAQVFRRFGSRVTVVLRGDRLLTREDADIARSVEEVLAGEGIEIVHGAKIQRVSPEQGVTMHLTIDGAEHSITASHALFALGRVPNTDRMNVKAAGLEVDSRGFLTVDDTTRTNVPHIYAVGDINGRGAFTHTSVNDGEIFWDHFSRSLGSNSELPELDRSIAMRNPISAMFIDPPLARVGMTEQEARESGRNVLLATMPMSSVARAREKRETHGMIKVLVDADTEQFLGVTIFGTGGDEVIGSFAAFMQTGSSYKLYRRVVFPHPTVTELMPWSLDGLQPLT